MKTNIFTLWMMGLLLVPLSAQAQTSGTTGPLQWNYHADTKTLAVTGTGVMPDYTSKDDQPWKAFRAEIEKITVADGVKTVGKRAFYECSKLTSITLPASVTELGYQAFSKCTALKNIALPSGIKTIRSQAFVNCTALTTFDVDAGNMHFTSADGVLYDKAKTKLIYYPAGKMETTFNVPAGVHDIGSYSFSNCTTLQSITLPTGAKTIGSRAFEGCTALQSIHLPNSISTIGGYAFSSCKALSSITFSANITKIGSHAFADCTGLKEVTAQWTVPLAVEENIFKKVALSSLTLKVPAGKVQAYKSTPVWKEFAYIVEVANQERIDGLRIYVAHGILYLTLPAPQIVQIYNVNGMAVKILTLGPGEHIEPLAKGIYLVRIGDTVEKILVK